MNDKSQVKSNDEFTVCPDCGGLRGNFAGTPCKCIPGDSTLELAGKERLTRPEDALISTLQFQLERISRERNQAVADVCQERATLQSQLTQAHKERNEAVADVCQERDNLIERIKAMQLTLDSLDSFLDRMTEAEWLINNASRSLSFGVSSRDFDNADKERGKEWINRRDKWLTPPTDTQKGECQ